MAIERPQGHGNHLGRRLHARPTAEGILARDPKKVRFRRPGVDGRHLHTVLAGFLIQRQREAEHECLGRGVDRTMWKRHESGNGGNVDHPAAFARRHRLQVQMRQLHQRGDIQIDHLALALAVDRGEFPKGPKSRVIDEKTHIQIGGLRPLK